MKILLTAINAKYIHSNLAVYSLYAYAKRLCQHLAVAEYTINHSLDFVMQEIFRQRPDVLCFSCYIWNITFVDIERSTIPAPPSEKSDHPYTPGGGRLP